MQRRFLSFILIHFIKETLSIASIPFSTRTQKYRINRDAEINSEVESLADPFSIDISFGTNKSYNLGLALFSSQGFIAECQSFIPLNCSDIPSCYELNTTSQLEYPQFEVNGTVINILTYIDSEYDWGGTINFTYANYCSNDPWRPSSPLFSGAIPLGVGDGMNRNFNGTTKFSIFIDLQNSEGLLIFGQDFFKKLLNSPTVFSNASQNWELSYNKVNMGGQNVQYNGTVLFDINQEYIVMPINVYTIVLQGLADQGVDCDPENDYCNFEGTLSDLPNCEIYLTNYEVLNIPSSVYLQQTGNSNVYNLNFAPSNGEAINSVEVFPAYSSSIILGIQYLNYYYTVFDFSNMNNLTITVYEAYKGPLNMAITVGIGIGTILLIIGTIVCCCCYRTQKKYKEKPQDPYTRHMKLLREHNITEAFLQFYNSTFINIPIIQVYN